MGIVPVATVGVSPTVPLPQQLSRETRGKAAVGELPTDSAARLSDADEKELLQLRSKIGFLREQLRDASNRVVLLQRLPAPRASPRQPPSQ